MLLCPHDQSAIIIKIFFFTCFTCFTKRFSSKSKLEERKIEGSNEHGFQSGKSPCQMDLTADQITDLVATDGSRSKVREDVHSVGISAPHVAYNCVPQARRASDPERKAPATYELRAPRSHRTGSPQTDRTSHHDRFQGIRNLDLPTRRLLEIDIIEPLDFDKLKYEMIFGRGRFSYK